MGANLQTTAVGATVYNLIPTRFPTVELYADLVDEADFEALYALEALTNPRLIQKRRLERAQAIVTEDQLQNINHAPFAYPNEIGTTYFDGAFQTAEFFGSRLLALYMCVLKREAFLRDAKMGPIQFMAKLLTRDIKGKFASVPCPKGVAKSSLRQIGKEIAANDSLQGVVFPSAHITDELVYGVTDGRCLQKAFHGDIYGFEWNGRCVTSIGNYALNVSASKVSELVELEEQVMSQRTRIRPA